MNKNTLQQNIRIVGLAFTLVFGFIALSATSVDAQRRDDRRDDKESRQEKDKDKNNRREDRDDSNRNNDDRYNGNRNDNNRRNDDHDNDDYYSNNQNRGGGYYNGNNANLIALKQAYRDGKNQGFEDAKDGRKFNSKKAAKRAMRNMDYDNNSRWGNNGGRGNFQQSYQDAFIKGYEEGFDRYEKHNRRYDNNRGGYNGY